MMDSINITMLGDSETGKTCFMVGMYATMRLGVKGFTFATVDPDDDLILGQMWDKMTDPDNEQSDERWPARTVDSRNYTFDFCYGFKRLAEFAWHDYRGGAINEKASDDVRQKLVERLKASHSIFICISGEVLANYTSNAAIVKKASIASINKLMHELRNQNTMRPTVAIVITKFDKFVKSERQSSTGKLSKEEKDRITAELVEQIQELYSSLFIQDSTAGWLVMICPVTLGSNLDDDNKGPIDPENVHLPVSFAIYAAFKDEYSQIQEGIVKAEERLQREDKWRTRTFNPGKLAKNREEIADLTKLLSEAQKSINLLGREMIKKAPIFYAGEKVELDV